MNKKDLAEEYAIKAKENAIYFKNGNFPNIPLYQCGDIKAAFNAGRESVVENIPDLEFNQNSNGGIVADNTIFSESYHLCAIATTGKWSFYMGYDTPVVWYDTAEEAMDAANNDYRNRIKKALGL